MNAHELDALIAPNGLDIAIARVFPRWGAARLRARREFSYEAARSTRLRNSSKVLQGPEDFSAFSDRMQLIRQVRDLEQNFGLFQSIIDKLALYAFGKIRYQARTGDEAVDQATEDYLDEWFDTCDISGRHDFQAFISIAFKSALRDGDFVAKWRRDVGGIRIQGIESDRIGGNVIATAAENYFQGITVDVDTGAPQSYDIYRRTRANVYMDKVTVPAEDVLLLFDPRRIDQYRGITPFAPIANEARDLKEVLEACLTGTKFENYHAAIGYTESGAPLANPSDLITSTETDANGAVVKEQQLKYGMIQWAPSSAEYEFLKSERPSGNFQTYVDMLVRLNGIALNLPYSFIYATTGTGPAVRADFQQAHRVIEWHRTNTAKRLMTPAKNMAIVDGIASGRIPYTKNWHRGRWQFSPAVSIDAGRDSAARVQERNAGLRSNESIFTEDGEDAAEQAAIIKNETLAAVRDAKEIAEKTGIPVGHILTLLGSRTPNGFLFTSSGAGSQQVAPAEPGKKQPDDDLQEEPTDVDKMQQVRELIAGTRSRMGSFKVNGHV